MDGSAPFTRLRFLIGDLTQQRTDAIVNAANPSLAGGGGVDGAIHRAGGPSILAECRQIIARIGRLETGQAVITGGGLLPACWVIHTVGPVWQGGGQNEDELLAAAYRNSLQLAAEHGLRSIAFPSISTGAYCFPVKRAAPIAATSVKQTLSGLGSRAPEEVRFVLLREAEREVYEQAWRELDRQASPAPPPEEE